MNATQIIQALGGRAVVQKITGAPMNTVVYWGLRQSIPAKHWLALAQHAAKQGECNVTIDTLLSHQAHKLVRHADGQAA